MLYTVHALFVNHPEQLKDFAKSALTKLLHMEKSLEAVTDKWTAVYNTVVGKYKQGRAQYLELRGRFAAQEEELRQAREIDTLLAGVFPDTQGVAEEAVEEHRNAERGKGVRIGDHDTWTVEEVILATETQLMPVCQAFGRVHDAGLRVVKNLRQSAVMPCTVSRLARCLEAAPE